MYQLYTANFNDNSYRNDFLKLEHFGQRKGNLHKYTPIFFSREERISSIKRLREISWMNFIFQGESEYKFKEKIM